MPEATSKVVIDVEALTGYYGETQALHNIKLQVKEGEIVCLLGRNGAGKTTTLRAVMGLLSRAEGKIEIQGQSVVGMPPEKIAHLGVAYCPEERGIFASLSTEENLMLPPILKPGGLSVEEIYDLFPNLLARRHSQGTKLSGGEQQMLAVGRALVLNPKLLLLDEPLEGLAPIIVQELLRAIARITRDEGLSAIIVEQHPQAILAISHQAVVLDQGRVIHTGPADELLNQSALLDRLLGISIKKA